MKRLYFDMDNVLVDFESGLNKIDEIAKKQYDRHLDGKHSVNPVLAY